MTNQLPPAPEGFEWMPCADNGHAARSFDGDSWVMIEHSGMWDASRQLRLMRRLKSTEIRHDINGYAFLGSEGFELDGFDERDGRFEPDVIESNAGHTAPCGWYATVRFAPGHVPDFGDAGLRYLDEGEPSTADARRLASIGGGSGSDRVAVPIALPPLPILDQMCAEKPGLREGIEREKAAHYAEEIDALRAQLAEVTAERDEAVNWMEGVLGKSLQRTEDWYHSQNRKIEALKAEVGKVTRERDALDDAAITALSGEVCTPAEGYVKAGANWLKRDIGELVAQRDEARKAIDEHRGRLQGFRKSLNSLDVTSPLDAREFAALHKIIEALTPE